VGWGPGEPSGCLGSRATGHVPAWPNVDNSESTCVHLTRCPAVSAKGGRGPRVFPETWRNFRDSPRPARPVPGKRSRPSGPLLDRGGVADMFQPGRTSDILNRCASIWRDFGESRRDPHRLGGPGAGLGEPRFAHRSGPICSSSFGRCATALAARFSRGDGTGRGGWRPVRLGAGVGLSVGVGGARV